MIMDVNTNTTFISMFQLAEKGELTKLEQKDVVNSLVKFGMNRLSQKLNNINSESSIDEEFKRIRLGTRRLLEQTEQCIDTALEILKTQQNNFAQFKIEIQNLPEFSEIGDNIEVLNLIKKLDKDLYNFSEAGKLVNTTRQTLKIHAIKQKNGLKIFESGKSEYLTKEGLIRYYRAKFKNDSLPF